MPLRAVLVLVLATAIAIVAAPSIDRPAAPGSLRRLSAVPLRAAAAEALRARGRSLRFHVPDSANRGRKFAAAGDVVGPLVTAPVQKVLVIFVDFTTPAPGGPDERLDPGTYFDTMLFGDHYDPPAHHESGYAHPTDRTLRNYVKAVSYGQVDVVTLNLPSSIGWAQSGKPYDYYCRADGTHDNGFGTFPENAQGLVVDAISAVDAKVDFSQYAVNGEVPNLFVVHAGGGAEWNGDPALLWSHSWSLDIDTGLDGVVADGVRLNNYAMMPEVGGDLTGATGTVSGPYPPTVGVYAHEFGHVLGLPDQYDYDYESEGTGLFSVMAGGTWNQWPPDDEMFAGNSPAFLDAWSRFRLGVVAPVEVTTARSVTLPPAESSPVVYRMVVPFSGGKEYFLFENRQQISFDEGLNVPGAEGGEAVHGLAIYHVDDVVLGRNYWRPNDAENWKEFRAAAGRRAPTTGETHYGISIIQADDRWDLERGVVDHFGGDLYPGVWNATAFDGFTTPNSTSYYFWPGNEARRGHSGVSVRNITEKEGTITATLSFER